MSKPHTSTSNPRFSRSLAALAALCLGGLSMGARAEEGERSALPAPKSVGLLQVWGTAYDQDMDPTADPISYGDPEDDMGFKIRRARLGVEGDGDAIRYAMVFGVGANYDQLDGEEDEGLHFVEANMGFRLVKGLWLTAGLQEVPVSRDNLMGSGDLVLMERSVATEWMIPEREVGAVFDGRFGKDNEGNRARIRVGAFNGNGDLFRDENNGKLITARLEGATGKGQVYDTYGKVKGFTLGAAGDFWLDDALSTRTMGYGGDLILRVDGVALLVEGHLATIEPANSDIVDTGVFEETKRTGALAQIGYSAGHFEPAVRFGIFDDDAALENNGDVGELMAGLTYHMKSDQLRFGGGFVHRMERQGVALDNDTARLWAQLKL